MARDLGRTVRELSASLTAPEFVEWMAFYSLEAEAKARAVRDAAARRRR